MSGRRAKLERKKLRAAGYDDPLTRKRKSDRAAYDQMCAVKRAREEALAKETPEQRALRKEEDARQGRRIAGLLTAVAMMGCGLPAIGSLQRQARFQGRGR